MNCGQQKCMGGRTLGRCCPPEDRRRCRTGRAARGAGAGWSLRHAPTAGRARLDPRRRRSLGRAQQHVASTRNRRGALGASARSHHAVGPGARKQQVCREGARGGPQWVIGPRKLTPAGGRGRRTHCQHAHTAHPKRSPSVAVMTSQHDAVARAGCGRLLHRVDVLEPRRAGRERVVLGVAALADDCSRAGYRSHGRARMRATAGVTLFGRNRHREGCYRSHGLPKDTYLTPTKPPVAGVTCAPGVARAS